MSKFKDAVCRGEAWPYRVYANGEIHTLPNRYNGYKHQTLVPRINHNGYARVTLSKGGNSTQVFVHRLVAETFLGVEPYKFINHINGIKTDNSVLNLEWVTSQENTHHAIQSGMMKSSLSPVLVEQIRRTCTRRGDGITLSKLYGVSRGTISLIKNNKIWKS